MLDGVTLAILAGGEGSRLGRPKAELRIDGVPILGWLLERFDWPGPTLLVTAPGREHPPACELFDREVVDPQSGLGPMRGVLTALETLTSQALVVTTVDMPGVRRDQLSWYVEQLQADPGLLGVMGCVGDRVEPFPSVYSKAAAPSVTDALTINSSMRTLGALPGFRVIPTPSDWPDSTWVNLNHLADLTRLREMGIGSADF